MSLAFLWINIISPVIMVKGSSWTQKKLCLHSSGFPHLFKLQWWRWLLIEQSGDRHTGQDAFQKKERKLTLKQRSDFPEKDIRYERWNLLGANEGMSLWKLLMLGGCDRSTWVNARTWCSFMNMVCQPLRILFRYILWCKIYQLLRAPIGDGLFFCKTL